MSKANEMVDVRMVRGVNALNGNEEYCTIKVPNEMVNRMVERETLEKAVGEKINVEIGHSSVKLLYIDMGRNSIFGHESAKKYVNTNLTLPEIKADYKRRQAVTTICGLLAKQGFDFPSERLEANMKKWDFSIQDIEAYSRSVGKWNRVEMKLKQIGIIK